MTHNRRRKPKKYRHGVGKKCTGCNLTLKVSRVFPENYRLSDIEVRLTATQEVTPSRREADRPTEASRRKISLIVWIWPDCQPRPILTVLFISTEQVFTVYKQSSVELSHGVPDTRVPTLRTGQLAHNRVGNCGSGVVNEDGWGKANLATVS